MIVKKSIFFEIENEKMWIFDQKQPPKRFVALFVIVNLDGAPCHRNKASIDLLKSKFNENLIWLDSKKLTHPPFSPDLRKVFKLIP